jgi:hypothetical protein
MNRLIFYWRETPLAGTLVVLTRHQNPPEDISMSHSTLAALLLATPFSADLLPLRDRLGEHLQSIEQLIADFRSAPVTPVSAANFERDLLALTRTIGRDVTEQTFNHVELEDAQQAPARITVAGETYRCRGKYPNTIDTLFGPVRLWRLLYEPLEPGERCLHPLEIHLGVVANCASSALAERVGLLAAQHAQRPTLSILEEDHQVHWTHKTLRKVVAEQAEDLAAVRQEEQVRRLIGWLRQAFRGKGKYEPVLAVGRDGIHLPMTHGEYNEASTATMTVFNRQGKRLGTVYLGRMPQEQQTTLSEQLTALLSAVLSQWRGGRPRLAYISDAGWHPTDYFARVLSRMSDPSQPGKFLVWQRVVDFYHATLYVTKLAEALFGAGPRATRWARRMRHTLKEEGGLTRVLQSASYYRHKRKVAWGRKSVFGKAYRYLHKNRKYMDYARYRRLGMPIGSGVTEAACKTLFTQRLKLSGMRWTCSGGQPIVDLRVLHLSGVYHQACHAARTTRAQCLEGTWAIFSTRTPRFAG